MCCSELGAFFDLEVWIILIIARVRLIEWVIPTRRRRTIETIPVIDFSLIHVRLRVERSFALSTTRGQQSVGAMIPVWDIAVFIKTEAILAFGPLSAWLSAPVADVVYDLKDVATHVGSLSRGGEWVLITHQDAGTIKLSRN